MTEDPHSSKRQRIGLNEARRELLESFDIENSSNASNMLDDINKLFRSSVPDVVDLSKSLIRIRAGPLTAYTYTFGKRFGPIRTMTRSNIIDEFQQLIQKKLNAQGEPSSSEDGQSRGWRPRNRLERPQLERMASKMLDSIVEYRWDEFLGMTDYIEPVDEWIANCKLEGVELHQSVIDGYKAMPGPTLGIVSASGGCAIFNPLLSTCTYVHSYAPNRTLILYTSAASFDASFLKTYSHSNVNMNAVLALTRPIAFIDTLQQIRAMHGELAMCTIPRGPTLALYGVSNSGKTEIQSFVSAFAGKSFESTFTMGSVIGYDTGKSQSALKGMEEAINPQIDDLVIKRVHDPMDRDITQALKGQHDVGAREPGVDLDSNAFRQVCNCGVLAHNPKNETPFLLRLEVPNIASINGYFQAAAREPQIVRRLKISATLGGAKAFNSRTLEEIDSYSEYLVRECPNECLRYLLDYGFASVKARLNRNEYQPHASSFLLGNILSAHLKPHQLDYARDYFLSHYKNTGDSKDMVEVAKVMASCNIPSTQYKESTLILVVGSKPNFTIIGERLWARGYREK